MNTLEQLLAMDALLDSPEKWTQGCAARDAAGNPVSATSSEARCWCLIGAKRRASLWNDFGPNRLFRKLLGRSVVDWQDAPARTFAEVKDLLARAIAEEARG